MSNWSKPAAVKRIFDEIVSREDKEPLSLTLDMEIPFWIMPFTVWSSGENKDMMRDFLRRHKEHNLGVVMVQGQTDTARSAFRGALNYVHDCCGTLLHGNDFDLAGVVTMTLAS